MKIDINDPKWTAYALGEITDRQEKAELEQLLEQSPEMRQLVEEIRQTGNLLSAELQAEPAVALTPLQRSRIEEKADGRRRWLGMPPAWVMSGAAAALVLLAFTAYLRFGHVDTIPQEQLTAALFNKNLPQPPQNQRLTPLAQAVRHESKRLTVVAKGEKRATAAQIPGPSNEVQVVASIPELQTQSASTAPDPGVLHSRLAEAPMSVVGGIVGGVPGGITSSMVNRYVRMASPPPPPRVVPRTPGYGGLLPIQQQPTKFNTEGYDHIGDNPFLDVLQNPLSTFSIDVDTASYSNLRRFLSSGTLPPKDAVRIEELVNYFEYDYKGPKDDKPFAVNFEITEAPWKPEHRLLRIGLKAREIETGKRPAGNLVFLLDISGSMADDNKLPLVQRSMGLLVDKLTESDRVAIVVYAGDTELLLPSTSGDQKEKIRQAIDKLQAGGSTNGASGIQLAYQTAKESYIKGGINRVILATDGDFNVGITNRGDLTRLIEEKAKSGIFLSALGFGMGNYKDATLEMLANKGRGNYAYIDTLNEAKKVLVEQINSTLVPIAKDVKIQVEFNPQRVSSYRLIGYEDRIMAKEDFNDDAKQAGVIGAGHAVTALYEFVPVGVSESKRGVDPLKYQKPAQLSSASQSDELLTLKVRCKEPEKDTSVLSEFSVKESKEKFGNASQDFKFAAAVAAFGMALRDSPYKGNANLESALDWAKAGKGEDEHGYRQEFIRLIHRAISISD